MLRYAAIFFVIALVAALFGFTGIAAGAVEIVKRIYGPPPDVKNARRRGMGKNDSRESIRLYAVLSNVNSHHGGPHVLCVAISLRRVISDLRGCVISQFATYR
jgi:hypothetical protein